MSTVFQTGALVDLGGIEGFVSSANLSWRRFSDCSEVVNVGQELSVLVLGVDIEREQVTLSLKELHDDPLRALARASFMRPMTGRVTKMAPIGAFVECGGIEGLLPVSEFTSDEVEGDELSVGAEITVKAVEINVYDRRVRFARVRPFEAA